jgi:integrase
MEAPAMASLTRSRLSNMNPGQWATESLGYGSGAIQARRTRSGIRYYYRRPGDRKRLALLSESGSRLGARLADARSRARAMAAVPPLAGPSRPQERSLGFMLLAYATLLDERGQQSAESVRALFRRHIEKPFPELWLSPAASLATGALIDPVRCLIESGKAPTAEKLRSYLRAAYAAAARASVDPRGSRLEAFGVTKNPMSAIRPVDGSGNTRQLTLTAGELQAFFLDLEHLGDLQAQILRFYLLTGCQRLAQLVQVRASDVRDGVFTLMDRKGGRFVPRPHSLPLIPPAREITQRLLTGNHGYLLSLDGGKTPVHPSTVYRWVRQRADLLAARGEVLSSFSPGDLRRSAETRLAEAGITSDIRSQLLSHGVTGVQQKHYDRHDWMPEKREALLVWFGILSNASGKLAALRVQSSGAWPE